MAQTPQQRTLNLACAGCAPQDISQFLGLSEATVLGYLADLTIDGATQEQRILSLFRAGHHADEIAAWFSITTPIVFTALQDTSADPNYDWLTSSVASVASQWPLTGPRIITSALVRNMVGPPGANGSLAEVTPGPPTVTSSATAILTGGSYSTLALAATQGTATTSLASAGTATPYVKFSGGPVWVPSNQVYIRRPIGSPTNSGNGSVAISPYEYQQISFDFDGSQFELGLVGAVYYRLWVNEQPVTQALQQVGGSSGVAEYLRVDFGTRAPRRIMLELDQGPGNIWGAISINYPKTATILPPAIQTSRIAFLEDSYVDSSQLAPTYGVGVLFSHILSRLLGINDVWANMSISGTGWVQTNVGASMPIFGDAGRLADIVSSGAAIVLLFSSVNDSPYTATLVGGIPQITVNAQAAMSYLKANMPNSLIIACGCLFPGADPSTYTAVETQVLQAATNLGLPTIPIMTASTPWFTGTGNVHATDGTGNADFYRGGLSADTLHPSLAGHDFIARRLAWKVSQLANIALPSGSTVPRQPVPTYTTPKTYPQAIQQEAGLVGYWRCTEKVGTIAYDLSGNGLNGVYGGTFTLGAASQIADGGSGVTLGNGTTGGTITIPHNALLALTGDLTVEMMINPSTTATTETIVTKAASSGSDYTVQVSHVNNGELTGFRTNVGNGATPAVTVTVPNHIAVVFDGNANTAIAYVNGVASTSWSIGTTPTDAGGSLVIAFGLNAATFQEIALYACKKSAAQILQHFQLAQTGA